MTFYTNKKRFRFTEEPTDPTVTDDSSSGYGIFDLWLNTVSCETFILSDPTDGAAKWVSITDNGGGGTTLPGGTVSYISDTTLGITIVVNKDIDLSTGAAWPATGQSITVPNGFDGTYCVEWVANWENPAAEFQIFSDLVLSPGGVGSQTLATAQSQTTTPLYPAPYIASTSGLWTGDLAAGDVLTFAFTSNNGSTTLSTFPAGQTFTAKIMQIA